ncbi:DUF2975 domain-containing protein [Lactococcus piscium]|uniref:DUF2975 domain-containing protein n=1 Tax=Pseudolactococcus carnosus TaxID=2749961 RepID=UPI001C4E9090|nr:DUF2975 domain-containing protein [Lactococcus carnosus]
MAKSTIKNMSLTIFKVLTWLVQLILMIASLQNIYWLIRSINSASNSMYSKFFVYYFKIITPNTLGQHFLSGITIIIHLIIIIMIFIIMIMIRKLITSIQQGNYFTTVNLRYIKKLFLAAITAVVTQFMQLVLLYPCIASNDLHVSAIRRNDSVGLWLTELLFVAILYVVYQVFHSGMQLKVENDEFV